MSDTESAGNKVKRTHFNDLKSGDLFTFESYIPGKEIYKTEICHKTEPKFNVYDPDIIGYYINWGDASVIKPCRSWYADVHKVVYDSARKMYLFENDSYWKDNY